MFPPVDYPLEAGPEADLKRPVKAPKSSADPATNSTIAGDTTATDAQPADKPAGKAADMPTEIAAQMSDDLSDDLSAYLSADLKQATTAIATEQHTEQTAGAHSSQSHDQSNSQSSDITYAALMDRYAAEQPITDDMIRHACIKMDQAQQFPFARHGFTPYAPEAVDTSPVDEPRDAAINPAIAVASAAATSLGNGVSTATSTSVKALNRIINVIR